jgi:hypothetical protein
MAEYLVEYDIPSSIPKRYVISRYIKRLQNQGNVLIVRSTKSTILCDSLAVAQDIAGIIENIGGKANIWSVTPIQRHLIK